MVCHTSGLICRFRRYLEAERNRLLLHLSYWGGWMNVEWQIVSLNEEVLIVKVIDKDSD